MGYQGFGEIRESEPDYEGDDETTGFKVSICFFEKYIVAEPPP